MNGTMTAELSHRVGEGMKVLGPLKSVWKDRQPSGRAKLVMIEGQVVQIVMYGCEI